jgi:hypothetical protein
VCQRRHITNGQFPNLAAADSLGFFDRGIVDPDKVTATYKDGLLQVVLPKAEEAKPKQIEVALK